MKRKGLLGFLVFGLVLLAMPVTCLGLGGKVSYPNGSPAAGALVSLIIDDTSKPASLPTMAPLPPPGMQGGEGIFPQGSPLAQGLEQPLPAPKIKKTVRCDTAGRFNFAGKLSPEAMIQVKAPSGMDFATVTLPAKLFAKGELAIVLQPTQ